MEGQPVRQELSPAIEDFARFRKSQDYSTGTLTVDRQVLKRFLKINGNIWVHAINEVHVERHFSEATRTRSAVSLRNDHQILNGFFKWCRATARMPVDSDPMFGRRRPRGYKRERNRLPVADFPALLDAAEERTPRDRALASILLYTLLRDQEACTLRVRDLNLRDGWLKVRVTKTGIEDMMPVSTELDREMRKWLTAYTEVVGPLQPHYYLVPARRMHPVFNESRKITHHASMYKPDDKIKTCGRIIQPILEKVGFPVVDENGKPCGEGAHTLRRSGARAMFDALVDDGYDHALRIVQSMLHHSSVTQTERYIGVTADRRTRDEIVRGNQLYGVSTENVIPIAR